MLYSHVWFSSTYTVAALHQPSNWKPFICKTIDQVIPAWAGNPHPWGEIGWVVGWAGQFRSNHRGTRTWAGSTDPGPNHHKHGREANFRIPPLIPLAIMNIHLPFIIAHSYYPTSKPYTKIAIVNIIGCCCQVWSLELTASTICK